MAKNAQQFEERPWGTFEVIHEFDHGNGQQVVIKKIIVHPQKRLSLQSHAKRREHWLVVEGEGVVVLDEKEVIVQSESKIVVETGVKHRIANTHPEKHLVFIEIRLGEFDEDDIIRYQDDFGRSI